MERFLPAGTGEIAHSIEPPIDRIEALVILRPGVAKPTLFIGCDRNNGPDPLIFEIEIGDPLERFDKLKTNVMHVAELLLHDEQRPQHQADGLFDAFMFVDQLVDPRVSAQAFVNPREGRVGDMVCRAPYPRFERGAGKP
ncbi:MAG: hypothetical protein ACXW3X_11710 [Rhodoplanes sp.]